jgi:hypothetical protein
MIVLETSLAPDPAQLDLFNNGKNNDPEPQTGDLSTIPPQEVMERIRLPTLMEDNRKKRAKELSESLIRIRTKVRKQEPPPQV